MSEIRALRGCNDPVLGGTGVNIELNTDLYHLAAVCLVGYGVAMVVDLLQGFLSGAVNLQLKHVNGILHPDHHVSPASGTLDLCTDIEIQRIYCIRLYNML